MQCPQQVFPVRQEGGIHHRSFAVDLEAALRFYPAGGQRPGDRLARETSEMAQHFPRWLLTVVRGADRVLCRSCGSLLVFDRGLRCAACEKKVSSPGNGAALAWFGLLPPIGIDGLPRLRPRLLQKPPPLHAVGQQAQTGTYLLVPLLARYPVGFPEQPVRIAYLPGFFQIPGVPGDGPSHQVHLLGSGVMCLFAPGEWRLEMSCREVLQQRAYAHVIKLLNFANGKRDAFAVVS